MNHNLIHDDILSQYFINKFGTSKVHNGMVSQLGESVSRKNDSGTNKP